MKKSSRKECLVVLGIHSKKDNNNKKQQQRNKQKQDPNKPQVGIRASTASGRFGAVGIFPSKFLLRNTP